VGGRAADVGLDGADGARARLLEGGVLLVLAAVVAGLQAGYDRRAGNLNKLKIITNAKLGVGNYHSEISSANTIRGEEDGK
jgi:hypothetical protein